MVGGLEMRTIYTGAGVGGVMRLAGQKRVV